MDIGAETADPGANQIGKVAWQRRLDAGHLVIERPREFDRVERVPAAGRMDAGNRLARQRPADGFGDDGAKSANAQRVQLDSMNSIGPGELQPVRCGAVVVIVFGSHRAEEAHRSGQPPRGECDDMHAGRIEPLQVVDRQQDRLVVAEQVDDRQKRRRNRTLVGGGAPCGFPHQDPIDGDALRRRQVRPPGRIQLVQQVGERGVRGDRLGGRRPGRQHLKPPIARPLTGGGPHRGLADTRVAVDQQRRRSAGRGVEELANRALFSGAVRHVRGHS